jgi:hypothetical protein
MRALAIGSAVMMTMISAAHAYDLSPKYTPHPQTDSERLQNFKPPPPAPKQDTFLDKAAKTYDNAPVRPSYNPTMNAPMIEYNKKW